MNPISSFFRHASNNPGAAAVASPNLEISNANFVESIRYFAASFSKKGIAKGSIVGVSAKPEIECVVTLALMQLGAISLTATEAVLREYRSKIDRLVTDTTGINFPEGRKILVDQTFMSELGMLRPMEAIADIDEEDLVRIVFSSGTTGTPKGVPFSAKNLIARTTSADSNWMPKKPFMSLLGLDTVSGIQTFYRNAFSGETYLAPTMALGNAKMINKYKVKSIKTSPARLKELLNTMPEKPEALEIVQVAGSLLSNSLVSQCAANWGITPVYLYGSTEVGTVTAGEFQTDSPSNVGKPVSDVDFEITGGQIRYRKDGMPLNYWLDDLQVTSGFRDGWFYPGDLGSLNSKGELILSGRSDDVVNVGGAKFNLLELDIWLQSLDMFKDVASFQVLSVNGEVQLGIAFVSNSPPIPEMILDRIRAFIPDLSFDFLIHLESIPRNRLDKVDRKALAANLPR